MDDRNYVYGFALFVAVALALAAVVFNYDADDCRARGGRVVRGVADGQYTQLCAEGGL